MDTRSLTRARRSVDFCKFDRKTADTARKPATCALPSLIVAAVCALQSKLVLTCLLPTYSIIYKKIVNYLSQSSIRSSSTIMLYRLVCVALVASYATPPRHPFTRAIAAVAPPSTAASQPFALRPCVLWRAAGATAIARVGASSGDPETPRVHGVEPRPPSAGARPSCCLPTSARSPCGRRVCRR